MKATPALVEQAGRRRYLAAKAKTPTGCIDRFVEQTPPLSLPRRNRTIRRDKQRHRDRHPIENAFRRLKDCRRIAGNAA